MTVTDRRDSPLRPPVPWWRDVWAWTTVAAVAVLIAHTLGAPLGEPVADDWDFVTRALFAERLTLLDGGGSTAFWRPLPHQIYYRLFTPLMLARPLVVAVVQVLLLGATALLAYRVVRTRFPGPWAAAAASFPFLAESTRTLISWPSHMVDVSLLLFSALAVHEAAHRRLGTALAALLAALLSKEVAVVTALMLPWVPQLGPASRKERLRWVAGAAAVTLGWGLAYLWVRRTNDLHLPHGFETAMSTVGTPWPERFAWTLLNGLRAVMSLPVVAVGWELACWLGLGLLLAAAMWTYARERSARERLRQVAPVVGAGLVWFAAGLAPLTVVYPMWMPHRTAFAGFGLGVALAGLLGSARPALLAALVALRLVMLAMSPGPPRRITPVPPVTGAFADFEKITRLQRTMVETRRLLRARFPSLPHGARIGLLQPPLMSEYAFGGSRALDAWYRDTTLRWERWEEFRDRPDMPLTAVVLYEAERSPQMMLVEPEAMRHYLLAGGAVDRDDWNAAMAELARADSLQPDTTARVFRSRVAGRRAFSLAQLGRTAQAEREARSALALWRECSDARYAPAWVLAAAGRDSQSIAHLDTLISFYPANRAAAALRDTVRIWAAEKR